MSCMTVRDDKVQEMVGLLSGSVTAELQALYNATVKLGVPADNCYVLESEDVPVDTMLKDLKMCLVV